MNNQQFVYTSLLRFMGLAAIQVLLLRQFALNSGFMASIYVFVYPLFVFLLPRRIPSWIVMIIAFFCGLTIDIFSDSMGVHASASVMSALARSIVLYYLEPSGGYNESFVPNSRQMGFTQFLVYVSILLFVHVLWFFSMEIFTPVYIVDILKNTIFSFLISLVLILPIQLIFNPRD
ncbi:MAG: hypothetical protein AAGI23_07960 [Bacteroidota bacterium]